MEPEQIMDDKVNLNSEIGNSEISKVTDDPLTLLVENHLPIENNQQQTNAANESHTVIISADSQTATVNNKLSTALVTDTLLSDEIPASPASTKSLTVIVNDKVMPANEELKTAPSSDELTTTPLSGALLLPVSDEVPNIPESDLLPVIPEDKTTSDVENEVQVEARDSESPVTVSEHPEIEYEEVSVEEEEEYEEDQVDEEGITNVVVKKRTVKVKKLIEKPIAQDQISEKIKKTERDVGTEEETTDIEEESEYQEKQEEEEEAEEEEWVEEEEIFEEEEDLEGDETKVKDLSRDEAVEEEEKLVKHKKRKKKKLKKRKKEAVDEGEKAIGDKGRTSEEKKSSIKSEPSVVGSVTEELDHELTEEELELKQLRDIYTDLKAEQREVKYTDIFHKRKLIKYFRKRKIDHAMSHSNGTPEVQNQYLKKLYNYEKSQKNTIEKKKELMAKWDEIKVWNSAAKMHLKEAMDDLYESEKQTGAKLVDTKTGKSIPDKIQEDLKNRQTMLDDQITQVHLRSIKLKNNVATKKADIKMDHMGSDFRLMDYEQLCIEKEDYVDRIIDRDYELKKVKQKTKDMQEFVEHMKEVSDTLQNKIDDETFNLQRLDQYLNQVRESLNALKDKRHTVLEEIFKMKKTSGLLTQPALLYDFEDTVEAVSELSLQLNELKELFRKQEKNILRLRSIFEKKRDRFGSFKLACW